MLLSQYFLFLIMLNFTHHITDQQQLQASTDSNKNNTTVNQFTFFSKITFHKKPNFSHWKVNFFDYLFPRNLTPYSPPPRTLMKDLSSPFLHPSKPVKKKNPKQQPKPLLRAVASASMCENTCRSYLLPCCSFNFILTGLDHFIFRHCKHLWLKAKGEF